MKRFTETKEYITQIEQGVRTVFGGDKSGCGRLVRASIDNKLLPPRVTVYVDGHDGITWTQIMALREVFGAEFNLDFDFSEGSMSESGTWWPGEESMVFTYTQSAQKKLANSA